MKQGMKVIIHQYESKKEDAIALRGPRESFNKDRPELLQGNVKPIFVIGAGRNMIRKLASHEVSSSWHPPVIRHEAQKNEVL
jgi:hypothetical protein